MQRAPKPENLSLGCIKAPLCVVKSCRVMCVGLFSTFKSFIIFDLYLEILERKVGLNQFNSVVIFHVWRGRMQHLLR
jgi:hypothetical protein